MNEPPVPEDKPYLHTLKLVGRTKKIRLTRLELICMVHETNRQPKQGRRGPKPTPWKLAAHRVQQMRQARDVIRSKGDEVTKQGILDRIGHRGEKTTIDRWLADAEMDWPTFLAE